MSTESKQGNGWNRVTVGLALLGFLTGAFADRLLVERREGAIEARLAALEARLEIFERQQQVLLYEVRRLPKRMEEKGRELRGKED